jgi:hypothetical protein
MHQISIPLDRVGAAGLHDQGPEWPSCVFLHGLVMVGIVVAQACFKTWATLWRPSNIAIVWIGPLGGPAEVERDAIGVGPEIEIPRNELSSGRPAYSPSIPTHFAANAIFRRGLVVWREVWVSFVGSVGQIVRHHNQRLGGLLIVNGLRQAKTDGGLSAQIFGIDHAGESPSCTNASIAVMFRIQARGTPSFLRKGER